MLPAESLDLFFSKQEVVVLGVVGLLEGGHSALLLPLLNLLQNSLKQLDPIMIISGPAQTALMHSRATELTHIKDCAPLPHVSNAIAAFYSGFQEPLPLSAVQCNSLMLCMLLTSL